MAVKTVLLLCTLVSAGESTAAVSHHKSRPRQANSALDARVKLRHAFHSSAVLNEWLYVDGGEFSSWNGDNVIYQYADTIVSIDLRQDWTNHSVSSRSTAKPPQAASLKNGGIWVDHKNGVLYTGFAGRESTFGDNIIYPQGLWSFTPDGSGSGAWENLNETADSRFVALPRPYMGQVASGNGLGFFLGGLIGYKSDKQTIFSSLTTYNLSTHELSNLVAPGVSNPGLEQMGGMIYVPNFGNQGILVNMGGFHDGRVEANGLISFRRVRVYDPESQRWFEQTATGEIPQPRKEFCIAGAPSSNHTYEVLIYAGYGGELGPAAIPYDSAFVLTIPGFYWVRARYKPEKPRHGLTCELVSGSQVLIVGGVDSTQRNATDAEDDYHGVFNTPDPFLAGLAIFDLTRLRFEPAYVAKQEEPYRAAPEIRDYYSTRGSKPETGFASPALEALFSVQNFDDANVNQTNAAAITRKSNAAAITGGVVGGVGCLVMAISFAVCLRRRRRRRNRPEMQPDEPSLPAPARDLALPCATQNAPVTTEVLHDKPREEATQESRQEMPSQDRREGRAEMSEQGLVAELPGDSSWVGGGDAKLSGHNRQISDLGQPTEENDDAGNEVVDEEGARKRDDVDECI